MIYPVNEMFLSIQGEGYWTGKAMQFIRLSGCNQDCTFCDTDHKDYQEMHYGEIIDKIHSHTNTICITGGEPTIHDLVPLTEALKRIPVQVHMETNGTCEINYDFMDWVTWSPKTNFYSETAYDADEVKFLIGVEMPDWEGLIDGITPLLNINTEKFVMPIMGDNERVNMQLAVKYVLRNPEFRLTVQQHKLVGYK